MVFADLTREGMAKQVKKMYDEGILQKCHLKGFVVHPQYMQSYYLTKEEYKMITGEEWTPDGMDVGE